MRKYKIFITRPIPKEYFLLFPKNWQIDIYQKDKVCPRNILLEKIKGVDAVISQWEDHIDKEFFQAAGSNLKIVANFASSFDQIDLIEAKKKNIIVTNTPTPMLYRATAEGAIGLLLSVAKRTAKLYSCVKVGKQPEYSPIGDMGVAIGNKTSGVIGLGRVGSQVAQIMHSGFENKILYFSRSRKFHLEKEIKAEKASLKKIFSQADFIFVCLPKTSQTARIIDKALLRLVKSTLIFISISPPEIYNEKLLIDLVKKGKIQGAGLDIYSANVKPLKTDKIILTGHSVNTESETTLEMSRICIANIIEVLQGRKPLNPVFSLL